MSEILKRSEVDDTLDHIINSLDDWKDDVDRLLAHDAALRLALEAASERIALDNAVCLCGCPADMHEDNGEDGEDCGEEGHECLRVAPAVLEIVGRVRLALETATREAEEERRTAEAAVKFLGRIAEVTWEAGLPGGDREQTLANVRALASRPAPPADAPPLPPGCTHDPSLVCLRCRVVIPMPAPPADAVREAAEIVCERLDGPGGAYYREIAPGLMYDIEALRAALSSPAPAPSAPARDIAKAIREQTERLSPPKPFDPLGGFDPAPSAPAMRRCGVRG